MRYTIKGTALIDCGGTLADLGKEEYSKRYHDKSVLAHAKLGRLEDAEDKLGIDLITSSKAIQGIKNRSVYDIEEKCEVFVNTIIYYGDDLIIKGYAINSTFLVKEYGKTWVLTKEELS